jgi:hypothetical protein
MAHGHRRNVSKEISGSVIPSSPDVITWDERLLSDGEFISELSPSDAGLSSVRDAYKRRDYGRAHRELVAHFQNRSTPTWFVDLRKADRETYCRIRGIEESSDGVIREADDLLANIFNFGGMMVSLGDDLQWHIRTLYEHSSTSIHFKRMRYLLVLADAYLYTGDSKYITKYVQILDRYLTEWPLVWEQREPSAFRVQSDPVQEAMSVAFRALVWIELLYTPIPYDRLVPVELTYRMIRSIWFAANQYRRFAEDKFIEANHHLFERGVAPFMFALMLNEFPNIAAMKTWSQRVASEHVQHDFLEDGSYLEPSVSYTMAATLELMYGKARVLGSLNGESFLDPEYDNMIDRATDLMFRLIEPAGSFPPFGDDTRRKPALYLDWISMGLFSDTIAASISRSLELVGSTHSPTRNLSTTAETKPLPETFGVFENAGYVSDRHAWSKQSDFYVMSTNTRGLWRHGHLDMLSVFLAVDGVILIDESAAQYYQFSHGTGSDGTVARGYLVNMSSHNTILAWGEPIEDDLRYSTDWNAIPPAVIVEDARTLETGSYVRASHTGYPSVRCTREVLYVRGHGWIFRDEVGHRSPPPGMKHSQRWHFSDDAVVKPVSHYAVYVEKSGAGLLMAWPTLSGVSITIEPCHELLEYTDTPPIRCTATFADESPTERVRSLPVALLPIRTPLDAEAISYMATNLQDAIAPLVSRRIDPEEDMTILSGIVC